MGSPAPLAALSAARAAASPSCHCSMPVFGAVWLLISSSRVLALKSSHSHVSAGHSMFAHWFLHHLSVAGSFIDRHVSGLLDLAFTLATSACAEGGRGR